MANRTLSELREFLRKLSLPEDYAKPLREIRDVAQAQTLANFHGEHDPEGQPWAPVAPATERKKRAKRTGRIGRRSILRDTDALFLSFVNSDVNEIGQQSLKWGTDVWYAAFHQDGVGRMHREMVGFNHDTLDQAENVVADFAEESVLEKIDGFVG